MKRLSIFLCVLMLAGILLGTACATEAEGHLTVVATNYPLYDMAIQIGGGHLNVVYQPELTADSIQGADILLCMGNELETDFGEEITVVRVADGIEVLEGEENYLTAPVNNMLAASYLADALCAADAAHTELYRTTSGAYLDALIELDIGFRSAGIEGVRIFCDDGCMAYFAVEYGVVLANSAEGAVLLHTFEKPAEEDFGVPYMELMQRNLSAFISGK